MLLKMGDDPMIDHLRYRHTFAGQALEVDGPHLSGLHRPSRVATGRVYAVQARTR
jgi:hypothetical protein